MANRIGVSQLARQRVIRPLLALATVAAFTVLGLYLRYTYASTSSPYIDEYTTMWVAQRTIQHGYPVFSTGALYAQGLVFTYLDAMFIHLFGFSELIARMPSLILSAAYIPLSYWVGKSIFSEREGLLTCALVALDPQSIIWGGRARNYSLLVFLVLLVLYSVYRGVVAQDRPAYRRLALLFFLVAVFSHNEAMLLYPALVVAGLLWRGWRWFLRWPVLAENLIAISGMALSYWLYRLMQPAGWSEVGAGLGEVALSVDLGDAWGGYGRFFVGPHQLPFVGLLTILVAMAVGYLLIQCWRKGVRQLLDPAGRDCALLFLGVVFVLVVLEMVLFVSEGRRSARYLFMLSPLFFLIASAMWVRGVDFLGDVLRRRDTGVVVSARQSLLVRGTVTGATLTLITVLSLPASLAAAHRQELQYDVAFQYVREHMSEGDKVMTFATSACVLYLGRCDYVVVEKDFHAYATQRGDHWVEAWAGAPILFTDDALTKAVEEADRMWFVIDQVRFRTRYTSHFIQYVWDHMKLMAREGRVFVFLAENPPPAPLPVQHSTHLNFDDQLALVGHGLSGRTFQPGDQVRLSLRWQGLASMVHSYSIFVHLVDASNSLWTQNDGAPLAGLYPTIHWVPGEIISDDRALKLPADITPGRYRLEVGVYQPQTLEHLAVLDGAGNYLGDRIILDYIEVWEEPPEPFFPQQLVNASLGDEVTLWGYDLDTEAARAREAIRLALYWGAQSEMREDYTVFVHLIDDAGRIWGQRDSQPENGFYPTSHWDVGEVVRDEYEFSIDRGAPPGVYQIEVGMYLLSTGQRLQYLDEEGQAVGDALVLEDIRVGQ